MKKIFSLLVILAFVLLGSYFFFDKSVTLENQELTIAGEKLRVEILDTDRERTLGLSGRESLGEDVGALFVFDTPGMYGFWMKDMNFPIDIIWIDENMRVVGVERGVTPESYPEVFYPPTEVKYVLEVNEGFSLTHEIDSGTEVSF